MYSHVGAKKKKEIKTKKKVSNETTQVRQQQPDAFGPSHVPATQDTHIGWHLAENGRDDLSGNDVTSHAKQMLSSSFVWFGS